MTSNSNEKALDKCMRWGKKLGWQTRGEKALLQGGEIDLRIATKAQLAPTTLMAIVELLTQCLPGGDIREPQVSSRETTESRGTRSHHAYRATHDQGGRCALAP